MNKQPHSISIVLLLLVAVVSIGTVTPSVRGDWIFSVNPLTKSVSPGGTATFTLTVTYYCTDMCPTVVLSYYSPSYPFNVNIGPDSHYTFTATSPTYTATMYVEAPASTPAGDYVISIFADIQVPHSQKYFNVHVVVQSAPASAWSIAVNYVVVMGVPGGTYNFITISVTGTTPGTPPAYIHLTASEPNVLHVFFSKNDLPPPYTSTVTINVDPTAQTGSYQITIKAIQYQSMNIQSKTVTVVVQPGTGSAWDIGVSPLSISVPPGSSGQFSVVVSGTVPGGWFVHLGALALVAGLHFNFNPQDGSAPFTSVLTVNVDSYLQPGTYAVTVGAQAAQYPMKTKIVQVIVGGGGVPAGSGADWAVLSVATNPPNPQPGDQVYFSMQMTLVSGPLQQTFQAQCTIDGMDCGSGSATFPGSVGQMVTMHTETPWTATSGTHTLQWSISTAGDPNPSNNAASTSFTVQSGSPPPPASTAQAQTTSQATTTTQVQTTTASQIVVQTSVVTQIVTPSTSSEVSSSETPSVTAGFSLGPIEGNTLLIVGALIVLALAIGLLALRRRTTPYSPPTPEYTTPSPPSPPTPQTPTRSSRTKTPARPWFCRSCGTQNLPEDQFCGSCGTAN